MKKLLYFILGFTLTASLQAQEAKQVFVNMPDSILPILTKVNRADCIDFLDSDMRALIKNRFDQQSEMTRLTSDYIHMQLSPLSTFELKLLPLTDTTRIICTIRTVCSKACDSRISFYTTDWTPLASANYITPPLSTDFLPDSIPAAISDTLRTPWETLRTEADILLMKATLSDSTGTLSYEYTTPQYMGTESSGQLFPLLKRSHLVYEWKDGRFVRKEEQ